MPCAALMNIGGAKRCHRPCADVVSGQMSSATDIKIMTEDRFVDMCAPYVPRGRTAPMAAPSPFRNPDTKPDMRRKYLFPELFRKWCCARRLGVSDFLPASHDQKRATWCIQPADGNLETSREEDSAPFLRSLRPFDDLGPDQPGQQHVVLGADRCRVLIGGAGEGDHVAAEVLEAHDLVHESTQGTIDRPDCSWYCLASAFI